MVGSDFTGFKAETDATESSTGGADTGFVGKFVGVAEV